jgi:hypothetical protein
MGKNYYEVVFEGSYNIICGMLEGFLLGKNVKWEWYSSKEAGIETETFTEIIKEWASLKTRLHHIVLEEDFYNAFQNSLKERSDLRHVKLKYTKSARLIKSCSFKFTANAFAKKYGEEIKEIIAAPPAGVIIENYTPVEETDQSAKGVELYAPVHDYTYRGEGTASGEAGAIIAFRKVLDDHPLVQVSGIKLNF